MNKEMTHELGQIVKIKGTLIVGHYYGSDDKRRGAYYANSMDKNRGKYGVIVAYDRGGYIINFHGKVDNINTYYDEMLDVPSEYVSKETVENAERMIKNFEKENLKREIDKGLDTKMYLHDPEGFQRMVDLYKKK